MPSRAMVGSIVCNKGSPLRVPIFYKTSQAPRRILVRRMNADLSINGETRVVEADADTPLLWVLRDHLGLTGTKFGCGMALCGACTVHVNGEATRSCVTPASAVEGKRVVTIEAVDKTSQAKVARAVQAAWIDKDVVQCGYCQSGQVMAAVALLGKNASPSYEQID